MPAYPIRAEITELEPYSPGLSIDEVRDRFKLGSVVKMASNENPLGTSPMVQQALRNGANLAFRYAQPGNPRLVAALGKHHALPSHSIVPGNGSDEIIDLLVRVCPTPGEHNVVACAPSFSMYRIQTRLCGVDFRAVPLREKDFSFNWQGLLDAVDPKTALVFITTPDNPSGYCPPVAELEAFAKALPPGCLLVVDEAYMDFCQNEAEFSLLPRFLEFPNLVILRTFSKSFGLAGLRLGYGIMPPTLADALRRAHMPFSVNVFAEIAGIAALADTAFYEATLQTVHAGRACLQKGLVALGCYVFPSHANFLMFSLPADCSKTTHDIFENLLSKGLIIRPLSSYGLSEYLRVSVGSTQENHLFLSFMHEALS